jgi:hypothetical protein
MTRSIDVSEVERGLGILEPVISVFTSGFKLPVLTLMSRMQGPWSEHVVAGVSAVPVLVFLGLVIAGVWYPFRSDRSARQD